LFFYMNGIEHEMIRDLLEHQVVFVRNCTA